MLGLYVCIMPLCSWENERQWVVGLYSTLLPLIHSFVWSQKPSGADFGLCPVSSLRWGRGVPVPCAAAVHGAAGRNTPGQGTGPGPGRGRPAGAGLRGVLPSWGVLWKATPCLVHFWEGRKKEAQYAKILHWNLFYFFKQPPLCLIALVKAIVTVVRKLLLCKNCQIENPMSLSWISLETLLNRIKMYYPDPIVHVLFLVGLVLIQNPCILEFPPYTFALCIKIALCRLKDLGGKWSISKKLKPLLKQEPVLTY